MLLSHSTLLLLNPYAATRPNAVPAQYRIPNTQLANTP